MSERILIVDDEPSVRRVLARTLAGAGYADIVEADSVEAAGRALAEQGPFALVLLDIRMPGGSGLRLLEELAPKAPQTVAIMVTAAQGFATAVETMKKGGYDFIVKPVDFAAMQMGVGRALKRRQRELSERSGRVQIDEAVEKRLSVLEKSRRALLHAMCRMGEFRDAEPHAHPDRVGRYSRLVAERLAANSPYAPFVNQEFIQNIFECAPLHDIGKVGVPDGVLLKPAKLSTAEMAIMQTHSVIGRDICLSVKGQISQEEYGFIDMAIEVTGSHHECWDGDGYPDGLGGTDIPLSARIVGLADFYDACRSRTVYRAEPICRDRVLALIEKWAGEKFDAAVVAAFRLCEKAIVETEEEMQERGSG